MTRVAIPSWLHRMSAIVLALALTPAAYAGVACGGWSNSAAARQACCAGADGACTTISADECCADGEQRQNVEVVPVVTTAPAATAADCVATVRPLSPCYVLDPHALANRARIHLLDSVFLI